jgi:hypothetical protein
MEWKWYKELNTDIQYYVIVISILMQSVLSKLKDPSYALSKNKTR